MLLALEGEAVIQPELVADLRHLLLDGRVDRNALVLAVEPSKVLLLACRVDALLARRFLRRAQLARDITRDLPEGVLSHERIGVDHEEEVPKTVHLRIALGRDARERLHELATGKGCREDFDHGGVSVALVATEVLADAPERSERRRTVDERLEDLVAVRHGTAVAADDHTSRRGTSLACVALDLAALCREKFGEGRAVACANLPYYITTPAITALVESGAFEHITVMVQKEVAERICAAPGTSAYSAFSIYVQYHAKAEILFDVPADCFVPRPKVDSAVLKLTPLAQPAVETRDEKLFFALVRAAFNMRRKTLVNALGPVLANAMSKEEIVSLVEAAGLDARIRGERLSLADYAKLADLASEKLNKG